MWKPVVIVATVAGRVKDFALEAAMYLAGVSDKIDLALTELQLTAAFLKNSDAKGQVQEETLRILVLKIGDVAQHLEDVIETYGLNVASRRRSGLKNAVKRLACIFRKGVQLYNIGREIDKTTARLADLRLLFESYATIREREATGGDTSLKEQLRRTYSHVMDRNVVGLEAQTANMVKLLVNEKSEHTVFSIWGMAGLGKSTLAKQIYHQSIIRYHFRRSAWVCVSPHFKVREIWEQILIKLSSPTKQERDEISKMMDDEIAAQLYHLLEETKYLVVLDDMWSVEAWDVLKFAFPFEDSKSRILITTRNEAVGIHIGRHCFLYQPQTLNRDQSWELFQKTANFGNYEIDSKMEKLGDEMLRHCGGLPLAITMLAGLLARKNTLNEWETVCGNVSGYIAEYGGPFWVLALSYDDLPNHLKACFLYFCHFSKDSEIPVKLLIKLWIAEGFILLGEHKKGLGDRLEDIAYNCLNELVERCVVHLGERGSTGTIKTCRMHTLMRELCLIKAEEENFLTCEYRTVDSVPSDRILQKTPMEKARRLAIHLSGNVDELVLSRVEGGDHNRSLFYFGSIESKKVMSLMFKDFKRLRVLKVEGIVSEDGLSLTLPQEIGDMVHLRFLSFKNSGIKSFPLFIGNLILLQTLDFRVISLENIVPNIPNMIRKLEQLRHLYLPKFYQASHTLQLSTLNNLQTLDSISGDYCRLGDLAKLVNLRKLRIVVANYPYENLGEIWESAGSILSRIETLCVHNQLGDENCAKIVQILSFFRPIYKLKLLGRTLQSLTELHQYQNLSKLLLCNSNLNSDQMAITEQLPNLRAVRFEQRTFDANSEILLFSNGGFLQLDSLSCHKVWQIKEWRVEKGAMPRLSRLSIEDCHELEELPDGLRYLSTLKELRITGTLVSKVKEGGDDFYKIQHVPSIILT